MIRVILQEIPIIGNFDCNSDTGSSIYLLSGVFQRLWCLNWYSYITNLLTDNIISLSINYKSSQAGEILDALKLPADPVGNIDVEHLMVPSPYIL